MSLFSILKSAAPIAFPGHPGTKVTYLGIYFARVIMLTLCSNCAPSQSSKEMPNKKLTQFGNEKATAIFIVSFKK